jgi:hypothetical protein
MTSHTLTDIIEAVACCAMIGVCFWWLAQLLKAVF